MESTAAKNIGLAFEVLRYAMAEEKAAIEVAVLADEGTLVIYDPQDPDLVAANDLIVDALTARGEPTVALEVNRTLTLAPHLEG